jgi:nucleoside-diphosphate-sugar epimerase
METEFIINKEDVILVTGANGFIGSRVVDVLLRYGFNNLRCFVRSTHHSDKLNKTISLNGNANIEIISGNLLSISDCKNATKNVSAVYHLAAGRGEKSYASAVLNSVVTTRNLLDSIKDHRGLKRFVNVGSITVYSKNKLKMNGLLDETCEIENMPAKRGEAYCYAKIKQDEIVMDYNRKFEIPYVIVRPGAVYGPGNESISGRVGIDTFGIFLHFGGNNRIPLTFVDNCAECIVLAGIIKGIDGNIFNVIDDQAPTSRHFLSLYKKNVYKFRSMSVPKVFSYLFCYLWEKYSDWSMGQLPPVFNRNRWASDWKPTVYSNKKAKELLGWNPRIPFAEAMKIYFEACNIKRRGNA